MKKPKPLPGKVVSGSSGTGKPRRDATLRNRSTIIPGRAAKVKKVVVDGAVVLETRDSAAAFKVAVEAREEGKEVSMVVDGKEVVEFL